MTAVKIEHNLGGWLRLQSEVGTEGHLQYGGAGLGVGKVQGWGPGNRGA